MSSRYLIKNGNLTDGSGRRTFQSDVLIEDGMISIVAPSIKAKNVCVIDATGKDVTPGFIDMHRHCDVAFIRDRNFGELELRQGITSIVVGNCGLAPVPLRRDSKQIFLDYMQPVIGKVPEDYDIETYSDYSECLKRAVLPLNIGFLAGTDAIRTYVKGFDNSPYSNVEIQSASDLISQAMYEGAFGASVGLMYFPDYYSTKDELAKILRPISEYDGILCSHIRGEGNSLVTSIKEVISIAMKSSVRLNISHFKATGKDNWNRLIGEAIDTIESAQQQGVPITVDFYPYDGGATTIQSLIPPDFLKHGIDEAILLFSSDSGRSMLKKDLMEEYPKWDNMIKSIGWNRIIISSVSKNENKWLQGESFQSASDKLGYNDVADFFIDLFIQEKGTVGIVVLSMSIADVERIAKLPYSALISDSLYGGGRPHPRLLGAYPHFLRCFVIDHSILAFEEAIMKMTYLPAERLHLKNRGLIKPGYIADVLIFNRNEFRDNADYSGPLDNATGMDYVFVGGELAIFNAKIVDKTRGKFLSKE